MPHRGGLGLREWVIDLGGRQSRHGTGCCIVLRLEPASHHPAEPRVAVSGNTVVVEAHLPGPRPDLVMRCRLVAGLDDLPLLHHRLHRADNHRQSGMVIGGMLLLLATCGWVVGGEEGAQWAVSGGTHAPQGARPVISPEMMYRQFGARLLRPQDWPGLFDLLRDICRRAHLPRLPALYLLPDPHGMNAYALGSPEASAITLTEGLLHGMTRGEIAGILAHEVGHIRNNDGWALNLAAALHRATALTSLLGLAGTRQGPLAMLLGSAPVIGKMLHMTLSRIREFDADAVALELVDDPQALVAALHKLERHHGGDSWGPSGADDDLPRFLRSHPETWERVGTLLRLAG